LQEKHEEKDKNDDDSKPEQPMPDLEQGKTLPEYLQDDVCEEYKCLALEDPDPYYQNKNVRLRLIVGFEIVFHQIL